MSFLTLGMCFVVGCFLLALGLWISSSSDRRSTGKAVGEIILCIGLIGSVFGFMGVAVKLMLISGKYLVETFF